jgi:hypothetical protein
MDAQTSSQPVILGTIRASAWPELFDCAHRFYWKHIMGIRMPAGGKAWLGTSIHTGTAKFDQAVLDGSPLSITDAVDATREKLTHPDEDVAWDEDLTLKEADNFAIALTTKYCADIAPRHVYAGVEVKCQALDIATVHGIVRVTGTTDRVRVIEDGRKGISDVKTGSRATEKSEDGRGRRAVTKGHHIQLGIYTLMAQEATGESLNGPAQIIGLQTTKDTPCATGEVADVKTPLLGTDSHPGLIEIAAGMLKAGVFPPNPKSTLCSRKYCPAYAAHCRFHD